MDDTRNEKFAAWVHAERLAYEAVHLLHQRTQGGRLSLPADAMMTILALRQTANRHLAGLSYPERPRVRATTRPARPPIVFDVSEGRKVPERRVAH